MNYKLGMIILFTWFGVNSFAQTSVDYYFSKTLELSFNETSKRVIESLKEQQFGIITEIEMHEKLLEKIPDAKIKPYRILGACNPKFAYQTLQIEENIGLFLPCKILIKYVDDTHTEVVMVNPSVLMKMLGNKALEGVADEVTQRFKQAMENL